MAVPISMKQGPSSRRRGEGGTGVVLYNKRCSGGDAQGEGNARFVRNALKRDAIGP